MYNTEGVLGQKQVASTRTDRRVNDGSRASRALCAVRAMRVGEAKRLRGRACVWAGVS